MTYIVENNGTYGLTKGQFSATNDLESKNKYGDDNLFPSIDLPSMAIQLGASFVARSFSGDKEQLVPLLKAALSHKGFSFLDIISPCVTFNNHNTSTKSYDYIREHNDALSKPDFVPSGKEILTDYPKGSSIEVPLHDGSLLALEKLSEDYDPADKIKAIQNIQESQRDGKVLTGLLYADPKAKDLREILNVSDKPLNTMDREELCPGSDKLEGINSGLR
jgi:2-oxoglutarate ferredoxin oxidoreductase subunit beta